MKVVNLDSRRAPLTWCDVTVANCQIGTMEETGPNIPAIRIRVQSGCEHEFCFSSIADLARLGDAMTRHAKRLAAIAAAHGNPN